jgi:integrase
MPIYKVNGVKKDGLQKYNVRVNYISDSGKPKQLTRTAYGSEAAKDLERRLVGEIKDKGENSTKKMTVQELFDEYAAVKKYEVRETSHYRNSQDYRLFIQPTMANVRIDKLSAPMLQEWKVSIEKKGYALKTKHHAYAMFRAILNYAVKMEYLTKNPLLVVGNFKDSLHTKPEMDYYTPQEFTQFITTARELAEEKQAKHRDLSEWEYYVFFNVAFFTGLRKSEIHALKWSDINGVYLSVKRSITQKLKGEDRETPPKNKSSVRTLQMPLPLIRILQEHKERQKHLARFSDDYRVCGGEQCLRDTTVQNRNVHYADWSGLKVIRIHDYRHSHVSVLANNGINIQEIARRLGHSKVDMTWNTYSHLYPREEERAVDVLNNIA